MIDLLIKNGKLAGKKELADIACDKGKIIDTGRCLDMPARETVDAGGNLITPPFVDSHIHLDTCLTAGTPRMNQSGTLLEGIRIWGELLPSLTPDEIAGRVRKMLTWSLAKGNLHLRSHVDISGDSLMAPEVLMDLKKEMAPFIDLQLVAFPQQGIFRNPKGLENMERALDMGLDVVGGIPHFEPTTALGAESVKILCGLAAERGLMVDMHCDESDDPLSRHVETLAWETREKGLQGRVVGSHLTSMHGMDNYYVTKLIPLMADAGLSAVCNPLVNMNLQGRHDSYPKRRGLMRVPELMDAGINVSLGHDDVMDPWYPLGSHDMLDVAHMGVHALHMTGSDQIRALFDAVTINGAKTLNIEGYGLEKGCNADMVILQAANRIEAIRLRPVRLFVIRRGRIISRMAPETAALDLDGETISTEFKL
ncbi:MAG TPA: cytosine deaminase [Desulfobacteraceae bacterium]|nr:cytosine deaminase [Desulfobacteraceae bacterium]|tara:strand:- start:790 stop:2061 length:1272 start_codon:yes stop_codon:yes gene_type:complete